MDAIPQRGPQLGLLLDTLNAKYDFGETKYSTFVALADVAIRDMKEACILNVAFSVKVDKSRHSLETKTEKRPEKDDDKNSSCLLAFMFYAAMQVSGTASFSATQLANETMTLYELDKFCRDFQIIPNLLSKHEIKALWGVYGVAYQQQYRKPLQAMTFADFQDFFVRMALYAYSKRGMKRMIMAVNGHFPPPAMLVRYFCTYCNFDDYGKVKTRIRTVGAETQGALNFRSSNETNVRAREEQIIDLRAKAMLRQAQKEMKANEAEFHRKKAEKQRQQEERKADMFAKQLTFSSASSSSSSSSSSVASDRHPHSSAGSEEPHHESPKKLTLKEQLREQRRLQALQSSPLPLQLLGLIEPNAMQRMLQERQHTAPAAAARLPHTHPFQIEPGLPMAADSFGSSLLGAHGNGGDDDDDEFHPHDDMTDAMAQYSPALLDELARFSWNEPGVLPLEGTESGGPFLDMGNLPPRAVCCITVQMRNLLPCEANIDVLARGFDSEDTKVTRLPPPVAPPHFSEEDTSLTSSFPFPSPSPSAHTLSQVSTKTKPLVPGMSKLATVSFTTSDRVGSQVGLVTIHAYSERKAQRLVLTCPVFYRIDPTVKPRSLLDIRSFPAARERLLGGRESLSVSFERRTERGDGGGSFARPKSASVQRSQARSVTAPATSPIRVPPLPPLSAPLEQPAAKLRPRARPSTAHK